MDPVEADLKKTFQTRNSKDDYICVQNTVLPGEQEVRCILHIHNTMEISFHILRRCWPSIWLLSQMQASKSNGYLNYTLVFIVMVLEFSRTH